MRVGGFLFEHVDGFLVCLVNRRISLERGIKWIKRKTESISLRWFVIGMRVILMLMVPLLYGGSD